MKSLNSIINKVYNTTWLIKPSALHSIEKQLNAHLDGNIPMPIDNDDDSQDEDAPITIPKIAVIEVCGPIGKELGLLEKLIFGGCDLNDINEQIEQCVQDTNIDKVVFLFSSPGGVSTGCLETAAKIKELGQVKETVAYTDTVCASAAYWLASQCNTVVCSDSANVGSVNAYCLLLDESVALANAGLKVTEIVGSNGKFKTAGASYKPLTDEEKQMFQDDINKLESQFINSVIEARPQINKEDCNGMCYDGETALAKGLVDVICPTKDDFLTLMATVSKQ